MNVTLLTVGSLKERYWREAVAEYEKRLSAYCKFRLIEVKDEKTPDAIDSAASRRVRQKEGEHLLEKIDARSLVVTLEIQGKKFDSEGFAAEMEKLEERSRGELCFVIGGSLGLSPEVSARAALHLSFSDLTFPHQLMRVLFLEQLYRSYRIRTGAPYHK